MDYSLLGSGLPCVWTPVQPVGGTLNYLTPLLALSVVRTGNYLGKNYYTNELYNPNGPDFIRIYLF
jgi:hypothetical protein